MERISPTQAQVCPTEDDRVILRELMDRKLRGVLEQLRFPVTADDILENKLNSKYPYREEDSVPYGATLAGMLYHHGQTANYVERQVPFADWQTDTLVSYFCSNVDKSMSFSIFHSRTEQRVYKYILKQIAGKATRLQDAYIVACLEAQRFPPVMRDGLPVDHRYEFVRLFKQSPGGFMDIGRNQLKRKYMKMSRQVHERAVEWNKSDKKRTPGDIKTMHILATLCGGDMSFDTATNRFVGIKEGEFGPRIPKDRPEKDPHYQYKRGHWKHNGGRRPAQEPASDASNLRKKLREDHYHFDTCISLDVAKFENTFEGNALFEGLVKNFPYRCPYEKEQDASVLPAENVDVDSMVAQYNRNDDQIAVDWDADNSFFQKNMQKLSVEELIEAVKLGKFDDYMSGWLV